MPEFGLLSHKDIYPSAPMSSSFPLDCQRAPNAKPIIKEPINEVNTMILFEGLECFPTSFPSPNLSLESNNFLSL